MLFIQSNSLALSPEGGERLRLLDALAARGRTPLMRSARRRLFQTLVGPGRDEAFVARAAAELERECAAQQESKDGAAYTPGELFCADDCVLSLVFGGRAEEGLSACVVYSLETTEPLAKLERFCRDVREALTEIRETWSASQAALSAIKEDAEAAMEAGGLSTETASPSDAEATPPPGAEAASPHAAQSSPAQSPAELPGWRARGLSQGLERFIAIQPADFVRAAAAHRGGRELTRASELMEDASVRAFLCRVQELRREGYTPRRLFTEAGTLAGGVSIEKMLDAGLLEREVRVSCRKSGHALFDLPSSDSLAAITISRAKCSQCAAPVADEVIEETINPTRLAVSLLEDGRWLTNRVYKIVRSLGIPDSEIATGPASAHGESYLAVNLCGNSFLFVTRDGDLTPAFCRRVVETVEETEATHLVVVITGGVEDEGGLRLYEFAWRRARAGLDLDTTVVQGLGRARAQIESSFEKAVRRELTRNLFALDAALGFSAGNFVLDWFKLRKDSGAKTASANLLKSVFVDLDKQVAS